jgi:WD40-like Beta Propeller Repeat
VFPVDGSAPYDIVHSDRIGYEHPAPHGRAIAYASGGIHAVQADGTSDCVVAPGSRPIWSPDSSRLLVVGADHPVTTLTVVRADGTGAITLSDHARDWPTWSPDGMRIAFVEERLFPLFGPRDDPYLEAADDI